MSEEKFTCNCGREFATARSLNSHARFCDKYIKKEKRISKYKLPNGTYRCECGKEFDKHQSLNSHLSHCDIHHKEMGTIRKKRPGEITKTMQGWSKFSKEEIQELRDKASKTYSDLIKSGKLHGSFKGRKHTAETRNKTRASTIKYLQSQVGNLFIRYNKNGCKFIDKLNEERGWNLQHAENGGEFRVNNYWLDGYDKNLNIAFEYDEPEHYEDWEHNILKERDKFRQEQIILELGCDFYRYNEKLDYLYKVEI